MPPSGQKQGISLFCDYGLLIFSLAVVAFYVICATPSIGWRDGPELVITADYIDIAHPSGFPTYNLLAKIATWLPIASLGFRITLVSALAGGASLFLLGLLLKKLQFLDDSSPKHSLAWLWAPLPFFALQQGIWAASIEVEVYSLNLLFLILLLYCAASWFNGQGARWLYAGGLLYGLACGNHAALSLYLPILLLLTFWGGPVGAKALNGPNHTPSHRILILAGLFLVGLSAYFLLLIRSHSLTLPINNGFTTTLSNFWAHVSDAKDRQYQGAGLFELSKMLINLKFHFRNLTSGLFWLGLPFSFWGLYYLWRRYQILSVALILLIIINLSFFYYWIDGVSAFLPTILSFVILVSLGLGRLGRLLDRSGAPKAISLTCALIVAVSSVGLLGPKRLAEDNDKTGFLSVELFWPDFVALPPESVLLNSTNWFADSALQAVYSARPDVSVVHWPSLYSLKPIAPVIPERFPLIIFPLDADGHPLSQYNPNFFTFFLSANTSANKPVYLQYDSSALFLSSYLRPDPAVLFLAKLYPDEDMERKSFLDGDYDLLANRLIDYINIIGPESDPPLARKAPAYIYYALRPIAALAAANSRPDLAERLMSTFFTRFTGPDGRLMLSWEAALDAHAYRSIILFNLKRYPEARQAAEKLIELDPVSNYGYFLLANSQFAEGFHDEALKTMTIAVNIDKFDPSIAINYARLLAKMRSLNDAAAFLTDRALFMRKGGMSNSAQALDDFAACLKLAPEIPDLPNSWAATAAKSFTGAAETTQ
jgi:tetratricopeptide (TPR) repeat protein